MGYEFWLSPVASRTLLGSERRIRLKMERVLEQLSSTPFTAADFQERSPSGRVYDVKCFDDIIVTYWIDHTAKEVRVIQIEVI